MPEDFYHFYQLASDTSLPRESKHFVSNLACFSAVTQCCALLLKVQVPAAGLNSCWHCADFSVSVTHAARGEGGDVGFFQAEKIKKKEPIMQNAEKMQQRVGGRKEQSRCVQWGWGEEILWAAQSTLITFFFFMDEKILAKRQLNCYRQRKAFRMPWRTCVCEQQHREMQRRNSVLVTGELQKIGWFVLDKDPHMQTLI